MAVVRWLIPDPVRAVASALTRSRCRSSPSVLRDPELVRLNFGIFVLHAVLMALFVVVPFELRSAGRARGRAVAGIPAGDGWARSCLMVPAGDPGRAQGPAEGSLPRFHRRAAGRPARTDIDQPDRSRYRPVAAAVLLRIQPARGESAVLVSRAAPPAAKGTAVGVYSSVQSLGTFVGASRSADSFLSALGRRGCSACCAAATLLWFAVAAGMRGPQHRDHPHLSGPAPGRQARGRAVA